MNTFGDRLVTLINGFLRVCDYAFSPVTLIFVVLSLSLVWLCLVEIDELDRQGTKPEVRRH